MGNAKKEWKPEREPYVAASKFTGNKLLILRLYAHWLHSHLTCICVCVYMLSSIQYTTRVDLHVYVRVFMYEIFFYMIYGVILCVYCSDSTTGCVYCHFGMLMVCMLLIAYCINQNIIFIYCRSFIDQVGVLSVQRVFIHCIVPFVIQKKSRIQCAQIITKKIVLFVVYFFLFFILCMN